MLKNLPAFLTPELLWILAAMGHGDELAVVDRNFPAQALAYGTRSRKLVTLSGMDATGSIAGIVELLPLDGFVPTPLWRMDPVDQPGVALPVHLEVMQACDRAEGRPLGCGVLERHAFYAAAERCFAIVQNGESRPYGCFILKKGVVFAG